VLAIKKGKETLKQVSHLNTYPLPSEASFSGGHSVGALVAAVNKKGGSSVPTAVAMLKELAHRGVDAHGVATPNSVTIAKSVEKLATESISSRIALGHNLSRFCSRDRPQPVLGEDFALVFEGRLFPLPNFSEVERVVEMLENAPHRNAEKIVERLEGSYVFAIAFADMLIAGRDNLGLNPLYYGENETTYALASERKALWAIGVENPRSFPPGNVMIASKRGFSFKPVRTLTKPSLETINMETSTERLKNLLQKSTEKRVSDFNKIAVAFSGGLDSSVITVLAQKCGVDVHLFSVGLESQPEIQFAETAADALGLPLHLQTYTIDDVRSILSKVLWLIEEPNVIKVGIAIPLYWVAENSSKLGFKVLLTGLGGDELFGGYQKYLREYERYGAAAVHNVLYHDVAKSYETNFQRDNKVCSFHKVELRLPFMDQDVVNFALGLPVNLKITSAEDSLRKRVLRATAQKLGVPSFIAKRAKKAIQYTTGVNKVIRRLAKEKGLNSHGYLREIFKKIYPEVRAR
jgi:asparagine synthase (glutamine-hydrolysing)